MSQLLHTFGNVVVAIGDHHNKEIIFGKVIASFQAVIVVKTALKGSFELIRYFVVHRDADGQLGVLVADTATSADLGDHACILDLTMLIVWPEACWPQFLVLLSLCQHKRLIRHVLGWLPFILIFRLCWLNDLVLIVEFSIRQSLFKLANLSAG